MFAVGEQVWGKVSDQVRQMSSALGGGLGGTQKEACGALSGGALVIGGLYGRTSPDEDDSECYRLVALYREQFAEAFGTTKCKAIRDSGYGSEGEWPCSKVVERAASILLDVLADGAGPVN